jgi:hypothetical protein
MKVTAVGAPAVSMKELRSEIIHRRKAEKQKAHHEDGLRA